MAGCARAIERGLRGETLEPRGLHIDEALLCEYGEVGVNPYLTVEGFQDSQHEGIVRLWFDSLERVARSPDGLWLTASPHLRGTVVVR